MWVEKEGVVRSASRERERSASRKSRVEKERVEKLRVEKECE